MGNDLFKLEVMTKLLKGSLGSKIVTGPKYIIEASRIFCKWLGENPTKIYSIIKINLFGNYHKPSNPLKPENETFCIIFNYEDHPYLALFISNEEEIIPISIFTPDLNEPLSVSEDYWRESEFKTLSSEEISLIFQEVYEKIDEMVYQESIKKIKLPVGS